MIRRMANDAWITDFQVCPSILAADFGAFREQVIELLDAGARTFHVDVMDGQFVPVITFGHEVVEAIDAHRAWLSESGEDRMRRQRRVREEITALVLGAVRERLAERRDELASLADHVLAGDLDAFAAAESLA